jgi:hypothetical protein
MLVATRVLTVVGPSGDIEVPVRIFAPEELVERSWGCRYEIDWPDRRKTMTAYGVDSVQALELALRMIGAELYSSRYHDAGQLVFERENGGYGFPVANGLRDLLVGDDAKFQ